MPMPKSLAPGYVKLTYSGSLFPHHMTVPVKFSGTPVAGTEPEVILKDASTTGVSAAMDDLVTLIAPFFNASTHFGLAEAHTVDATTGEDKFIWGWDLSIVGGAGAANTALAQDVFVFKLTNGSLYKLYLMEDVASPNTKAYPPFSDAAVSDLISFVTGNGSPIYGRGNAYPFAVISRIDKTNDKLRKQHGLS